MYFGGNVRKNDDSETYNIDFAIQKFNGQFFLLAEN